MLDTFGILVSTLVVLFVTFRAIMLDRLEPWFEPVPEQKPKEKTAEDPARPDIHGGRTDRYAPREPR